MKETGSSSPGMGHKGEHTIAFSGTKEEIDALRQMMCGSVFVSFSEANKDGKRTIIVKDRYNKLPEPIDDPFLPPQWMSELGSVPAKWAPKIHDMIPEDYKKGWCYPSYYLSHILDPKRDIPKIQDWGFECMRSRRGYDGKFWEVWYLFSEIGSKNELADFIQTLQDKPWYERSQDVCHWIAKRVRFGSLSVSVQRMALCMDD